MMNIRYPDHIGARLLLAAAIVLLALSFASLAPLIFLAIIGLTFAAAVVLRAPVWVLIGAVVAGPTMGGWLDFSFGAIPAATVDRAMLLAVTVYLALMVLGRRLKLLPLGRIEAAMACFGVIATVSLAIRGGSMPQGVESGLRLDVVFLAQSYLLPFMYFFLAKNMVHERYFRWILRLYVLVGVFIALVAILQSFTGITWFTSTRYKVIHEGRAVGTLHSAPHFGVVMSICVISAIALVASDKAARKMATAALVVMLTGIGLSKTRAVYLGLLASLGALAILMPRTRRTIFVGALLAITALIVAWPVLSQSNFVRTRLMDPVPVYNRIALWGTAANMVLHKPITGFGFGQRTYREERADYFVHVGDVPPDYAYSLGATHNEYLHILVTTGLLGFVPYVAVLLLLWRLGVNSYRRKHGRWPSEPEIAFVAMVSLAMYLINGFFADLHASWYGSNMIFFLFGVLEGSNVRRAGVDAPGSQQITRARA